MFLGKRVDAFSVTKTVPTPSVCAALVHLLQLAHLAFYTSRVLLVRWQQLLVFSQHRSTAAFLAVFSAERVDNILGRCGKVRSGSCMGPDRGNVFWSVP